MTVRCPHCSTGYLLPEHLLGPRGVRVRCPHCGESFVVLREPEVAPEPAAVAPAAESGGAPATTAALAEPPEAPRAVEPGAVEAHEVPAPSGSSEGAAEASPERVAAELLDALAARLGPRLEAARASGHVLSELGPDLIRAWDDFRGRLGGRASAEVFRDALHERWAVDLGPRPGRSAPRGR